MLSIRLTPYGDQAQYFYLEWTPWSDFGLSKHLSSSPLGGAVRVITVVTMGDLNAGDMSSACDVPAFTVRWQDTETRSYKQIWQLQKWSNMYRCVVVDVVDGGVAAVVAGYVVVELSAPPAVFSEFQLLQWTKLMFISKSTPAKKGTLGIASKRVCRPRYFV